MNASGPRRSVVKLPGKRRRGSAQFVLLGLPFEGARGRIGWGGLRLALLRELLRPQAVVFDHGRALDWDIEHFKRAAAGVDLVIMGEIGKALEDAEQLLVPGAAGSSHCRPGTAN